MISSTSAPAWAVPAVIGVAGASACTLVAIVDPGVPGRYPTCPFLALTGRPCPGCGALRALHQLLHGHLATAVGLNPFFVVILPFLVWIYLRSLLLGTGLRPLPALRFPPWSVRAFPWVVVAFWVLRNVPVAPLDALAP